MRIMTANDGDNCPNLKQKQKIKTRVKVHCHIFDPLFLSPQLKEDIHTNRTKKNAS